jgi:ribosomal protein S18 acetylase RimI-like enzyme
MTTENRQGLYCKQGLTEMELEEIAHLAQLCNTEDGLDLKLNWETLRGRSKSESNDFLYYEQNALIGFLGLYAFNSREAEVSGMVHPTYRRRGIFTQLLSVAQDEIRRRHIPTVLFIVEHTSTSGQAFVRQLTTTYDHSEYKMLLEQFQQPAGFDERLQFREARIDDLPALKHITAEAFGMADDEVDWYSRHALENPARRYYLATLSNVVILQYPESGSKAQDDQSTSYSSSPKAVYMDAANVSTEVVIGKLDVSLGEQSAFIYGFAVLPEYRGRGHGRQILARTIQELLAQGRERIALEVATQNRNALSLYQSCGFRETGSYDYYAFAVSGEA